MAEQQAKILFTTDGALANVTLNRPEKLNAIDPEMLTLLDDVCARLEHDRHVRVVLLTGAGERAFSVGADIGAWSALQPLDMWRHWIRDGHRIFGRLASLRQPVIAVLNGYTFGGGLEIALAADLRVAASGVELSFPEVKLGTIPGWAGTQRLPALIGASRAKRMILTGDRFDAATAERWGLVDEVASRERLMERALELAGVVAANAPVAVQAAKSLIDGAGGAAAGVAMESLASGFTATTDDAREGLAAYRERRPPRFTGSA